MTLRPTGAAGIIAAVLAVLAGPPAAGLPEDLDPPEPKALKIALTDACSVKLVEGRLVIDTALQGARLVDQRLEVEGLAGETTLTLRPRMLRFENTRTESNGSTVTMRIESRNTTDRIEVNGREVTVELRQYDGGHCRMTVYDGSYTTLHNVSAEDFATLRRENAAVVNQYLGPVFRTMRATSLVGADEALARRALSERRPPAKVREAVWSALRHLEAESFVERESAAARLRALGQDALLYLESMDRKGLSAHQQTEVDALLRAAGPRTAAEVEALRSDPSFLLDCLYLDDPALRAAALARLRATTARDLRFDPKADPFPQAPEIESFRAALAPAATQPAEAKEDH